MAAQSPTSHAHIPHMPSPDAYEGYDYWPRIHELNALDDEARRVWLDWAVKVAGKCRYCGATVTDTVMARSPGVCCNNVCQRKGREDTNVVPSP
jgi:hypothetical protein